MAADDSAAGEVAETPPVTMSNTKTEIVEAAVEAGFFNTAEEAETWTKADLIDLWYGG